MKTCICLALFLPSLALAQEAKKPIETFTSEAKAGPDFSIQGEYEGEGEPGKFGAQVIADGDGQFTIRGYIGGLPGSGWTGDKADTRLFKGKLEGGIVKFGNNEVEAVIDDGAIKVKLNAGEVILKRVVRRSPTEGARPPEGAVVLFDGTSADQWTKSDGKSPATWVVEGGIMTVRGGDILSRARFAGPHTIHIEFMLPFMPRARGQGRSNSGVYIQNRYELQILDSFGLEGKNNEAGGFYQAHDPKINMCYPPLQWQTYDIDVTPAKFDGGKKTANARCTVRHNGVIVQDDVELKGPSPGGAAEDAFGGGIRLQDHGNPLMFRNIWVVEKK